MIIHCPSCAVRNLSNRETCAKCGWVLSRPYSLEVTLAEMEERDPALKEKAARVHQAAKDAGLIKEDS